MGAQTESPTLVEVAAALKHDLGKYVAWLSANLEEQAWVGPVDDALVSALRSDVLETRRGHGKIETAWEVFERLTRSEPRPWRADELERVAAEVAFLREIGEAIASGDREVLTAERSRIRCAQQRIREELNVLHRRCVSQG